MENEAERMAANVPVRIGSSGRQPRSDDEMMAIVFESSGDDPKIKDGLGSIAPQLLEHSRYQCAQAAFYTATHHHHIPDIGSARRHFSSTCFPGLPRIFQHIFLCFFVFTTVYHIVE